MLDTLSRPGGRLQSVPGAGGVGGVPAADLAGLPTQPPDAAQVANAVARYRVLRVFRDRLYGCLTARADACFELVDAILCADHAVTSLVQLSLVPQFGRGHGALYDALAAGQIDEEAFAVLLTGTLPQLADGDEGRAWAAEHDRIDYGLLDRALAGVPAEAAGRGLQRGDVGGRVQIGDRPQPLAGEQAGRRDLMGRVVGVQEGSEAADRFHAQPGGR